MSVTTKSPNDADLSQQDVPQEPGSVPAAAKSGYDGSEEKLPPSAVGPANPVSKSPSSAPAHSTSPAHTSPPVLLDQLFDQVRTWRRAADLVTGAQLHLVVVPSAGAPEVHSFALPEEATAFVGSRKDELEWLIPIWGLRWRLLVDSGRPLCLESPAGERHVISTLSASCPDVAFLHASNWPKEQS